MAVLLVLDLVLVVDGVFWDFLSCGGGGVETGKYMSRLIIKKYHKTNAQLTFFGRTLSCAVVCVL